MKVLIRVDASVEIGSGHLMRCLTLAGQLENHGATVKFICKDLPGAMFAAIESSGYSFKKMTYDDSATSQEVDAHETIKAIDALFCGDLDWLVVDHYNLDEKWESLIRPYVKKIMVIDDLANRKHDCDVLLDQNFYADSATRYESLVLDSCIKLLGTSHLLLRPEFFEAKKNMKIRNGIARRVIVFFGGSDVTNQTSKLIQAIQLLNTTDLIFDIVIGASNPNRYKIEALCRQIPNINLHCQISNMAELMVKSDLAIGAGGAAMWERCYLGLPSITVVFAKNQEETTQAVAAIGAIDYLGWSKDLTATHYVNAIKKLLSDPLKLVAMSDKAMNIIEAPELSAVEIMEKITIGHRIVSA